MICSLVLFFLLTGPTLLHGCPMCTVNGRDLSLPLYGAFLLLPYLVFALGFLAFKRIVKKENNDR